MAAQDAPAPDLEETYVETRWVPVDELHHFEGNANKGDVPGIRASIRRTGQYRALIVRESDDGRLVVLAGNNTLDALRAEGRERARCEIHRCDDTTALRINVADNKIARAAVVDEDALLEQLSFLDGDYEGTGFTDGEVNYLLGEGGPPTDDGYGTDGLAPDTDDATGDGDDDEDDEPAGAPGSAGLIDRPDDDRYKAQFAVMVVCRNEDHQQEVYDELSAEGYELKVVTV